MKLSYSCLPNVERIIAKHNRKILNTENAQDACNCVDEACPVEGSCQSEGVIYKATVTTEHNSIFKYIGLTGGSFKQRHTQHLSNFRTRNPKNKTKLSEKIWSLEDRDIDFQVKWEILQRSKPYHQGSGECQLCLAEIYHIIFHPEESDLNSRNEFMNKCRHKNKYFLCNN